MPSNHLLHEWQPAEARSACAYRLMLAKLRRAETFSAQELSERSELSVAASFCQQRYPAWLKGQADDQPAWLRAATEALADTVDQTSEQGPLAPARAPTQVEAQEQQEEQEQEPLQMRAPRSPTQLQSQQPFFKP